MPGGRELRQAGGGPLAVAARANVFFVIVTAPDDRGHRSGSTARAAASRFHGSWVAARSGWWITWSSSHAAQAHPTIPGQRTQAFDAPIGVCLSPNILPLTSKLAQ